MWEIHQRLDKANRDVVQSYCFYHPSTNLRNQSGCFFNCDQISYAMHGKKLLHVYPFLAVNTFLLFSKFCLAWKVCRCTNIYSCFRTIADNPFNKCNINCYEIIFDILDWSSLMNLLCARDNIQHRITQFSEEFCFLFISWRMVLPNLKNTPWRLSEDTKLSICFGMGSAVFFLLKKKTPSSYRFRM